MYLSGITTKQNLCNDILSFQTLSVPSSGSVPQTLTNGISRPRYLLICPQMAGQINGSTTASLTSTFAAGIKGLRCPLNSPFSLSPGTSGPQASISNLNILISGSNIYQSNYIYGYKQYLQEVRGSNAINEVLNQDYHRVFFHKVTGEMGIDSYISILLVYPKRMMILVVRFN